MKHDVRMRGFAERVDVEVVEAFLAERANPLAEEPVGLLESVGRVLAEDVRAEVDVPGFPRSAMDGYAIRGEESITHTDFTTGVAYMEFTEAVRSSWQRGVAVSLPLTRAAL